MRLPQPLLDSPYFLFQTLEELTRALAGGIDPEELAVVRDIDSKGLMPVTSPYVLGTMFGVNPGLIWSFVNRPQKHYRSFSIPKGRSYRLITAPRVALKIIQKWISVQLNRSYAAPAHVFGFYAGRSHLDAARVHLRAGWVFSVDIKDFFQTTPETLVRQRLGEFGYSGRGLDLLTALVCFSGGLPQGSPASPVLSNICFGWHDQQLRLIADHYGARLSRYADDIVFSGVDEFPDGLRQAVLDLFDDGATPWALNPKKVELSEAPQRRKVHGLLVHGDQIRLTKGYRNRLRAFRHLLAEGKARPGDRAELLGHLAYAAAVDGYAPPEGAYFAAVRAPPHDHNF